MRAQKQGKNGILMFFGELYLTFPFESYHQDRNDEEQKAIFKSHFQNFTMVAQNSKTR